MSGPVHWHEGLFLQPHHLQTMQHYFLERFGSERRLGYIFPYGVIDMKLSADALENMLVRFDRLVRRHALRPGSEFSRKRRTPPLRWTSSRPLLEA